MRIINLTPHEVRICAESLEPGVWVPVLILSPSSQIARCHTTTEHVAQWTHTDYQGNNYGPFPVYRSQATYDIEGIPDPQYGIIYLVSTIVKNASTRKDLVSPGELIRNKEGQPIGCKGVVM